MTNLRQHGLNRITAPYFGSIAATFAGIGLTIAERVWTVRRQGGRGMLVAALFLPELAYDWLRQAVWIHAAVNAVSGAEQKWMAT